MNAKERRRMNRGGDVPPGDRYDILLRPCLMKGGAIHWVASHPAMPGCMTQGETVAEALEMLADARTMFLEDFAERRSAPPAPDYLAHNVYTRHKSEWSKR